MTAEELRKLASAASPGPWKYDMGNWQVEKVGDPDHRAAICETNYECEIRSRFAYAHDDGEFIAAANPATVLKLLDIINDLQGALWNINAVVSTSALKDDGEIKDIEFESEEALAKSKIEMENL